MSAQALGLNVLSDLDIYVHTSKVGKLIEQLTELMHIGYDKIKVKSNYGPSSDFLRRNNIVCVFRIDTNFVADERLSNFNGRIDVMAVAEECPLVDVVKNFDLTCCMYYDDGDGVKFALNPDFEVNACKIAYLMPAYYKDVAQGSKLMRYRLQKYHERMKAGGFELQVCTLPCGLSVEVLTPLTLAHMSLQDLEILDMNYVGPNTISVYHAAISIGLNSRDMIDLLEEHGVKLDGDSLIRYLTHSKKVAPLLSGVVGPTLHGQIARLLLKTRHYQGVAFDKVNIEIPSNLPPFEQKHQELYRDAIDLLVKSVSSAPHESITLPFLRDTYDYKWIAAFVAIQDQMRKSGTPLYSKDNALISMNECMKSLKCSKSEKKKAMRKVGSSSRFTDVLVPPMIQRHDAAVRNMDMKNTCDHPMKLVHFITDGAMADGTPDEQFVAEATLFTHDVIYTHKDVDWYWAPESWKNLIRVDIDWPAGSPYYDFCHYDTEAGNVCILPPAMWRVKEEITPPENSYFAKAVIIAPVRLFFDVVAPQLNCPIIVDTTELCTYLYDDFVAPSQQSADLQYTLTKEAIFFKDKCTDNYDRRGLLIRSHPDRPGGDSEKFKEISNCKGIDDRFAQDLLKNLHFIRNVNTVRSNTCPNLRYNTPFIRLTDKRAMPTASLPQFRRAEESIQLCTARGLLSFASSFAHS